MTWLTQSKYERIPITAATGPGTYVEGYPWRWVNHSTEGPPGSIAGTISLFKARPFSCPHLMIDPMGTGRRVQMIPLEWSAAALVGGAHGYQTNRGRAIQVEICGYAREAGGWPDSALWTIADTIADVIKSGIPINPHNVPDDSGLTGTLATRTAPQRMSWEQWKAFDGVCAHVRVPNNDHWDTGRINSRRLQELVIQILDGTTRVVVPAPPDTPLPPAPSSTQIGYIAKGMTGGTVKFVQDLLGGLGYDVGPHDGVFGFGTEQAVKRFQSDHHLVVDGVVGPATNAAISAAYAPLTGKPPIPPPADPASGAPRWPGRVLYLCHPPLNGGDVTTWQRQMAARGWRIAIDGIYGPASRNVCKTFQAEKGLTVDGMVGPQTWNAAWTAPVT